MDAKDKKCVKKIAKHFARNVFIVYLNYKNSKIKFTNKGCCKGTISVDQNYNILTNETDTHFVEHIVSLIYLNLTLKAIGIPSKLILSGILLAGFNNSKLINCQIKLHKYFFDSIDKKKNVATLQICHRRKCDPSNIVRWINIDIFKKNAKS
ncbi:hypothetical protein HZS_1941, partial [Henneguya salminicola]